MPYEPSHESDSKGRILKMQKALDECADKPGEKNLSFLSSWIDAQIKLEDYRIRFREAQHSKLKVWSPIIVPAIVSIIVTVLALWLKRL